MTEEIKTETTEEEKLPVVDAEVATLDPEFDEADDIQFVQTSEDVGVEDEKTKVE